MARRFRVTANFPILETNAHQTVIVEGSNWQVALGKAAREFKRLPVMHRRRVTALSMMVEQIGQPADSEAPVDAQPISEETVMEAPTEGEALNQQANDEAERLIAEGQAVDDSEDIT
jgi:hypothetical protein